jgi:hypothetical protein
MDANQPEWRSLAARIQGLADAVEMYSRFPSNQSTGAEELALWTIAASVIDGLHQFAEDSKDWMPEPAKAMMANARLHELLRSRTNASANMRAAYASEAALILRMIRSEVDYFLADRETVLQSRIERALLHLQWSIASTDRVKDDWQQAFAAGETKCEALGATHLLAHGIFAFKAHTSHARTDLIYREPVTAAMARLADALVLTEWKKASTKTEMATKTDEARLQAGLYAASPLQGVELRSVRFIIVVSEEQMSMPVDVAGAGFVFRHMNIAVNPMSPSDAAKKIAAGRS